MTTQSDPLCDLLSQLLSNPTRQQAALTDILSVQGWYHASYPVILNSFGSSARRNAPAPASCLDQRLRSLLVGSWVARILKPTFGQPELEKYSQETEQARSGTLREFSVSRLDVICHAANRLLNTGDEPRLPTVSKLLHFDMPLVFPILDTYVANNLSLKPNVDSYKRYVTCLQELAGSQLWVALDGIAKQAQVPVLRVVDTIVF